MKKTIFIFVTMLMALMLLFEPTHVKASANTAKTQSQLNKLLKNNSVKTIKISTSKKCTFSIPKGDYQKKKLVINAPNTHITNNGKFSNIAIKNLTKYIEKTNGNSLDITDNKVTVNVSKGASLKNVSVSNNSARLSLSVTGNVDKLIINSAKVVGIHGSHSKPINVVTNDKNTKLNISSLVTFTIGDIYNETIESTNIPENVVSDNDSVDSKQLEEEGSSTDLSEIDKQAYENAYNNWLNYFISHSHTTNSNINTNINAKPNNDIIISDSTSSTTPDTTTPSVSDNESSTNNTVSTDNITKEPIIEDEESNKPVNTYQITFTHCDNTDTFTTYTGRCQYVYVSNVSDNSTPLESTNWEVSIADNNETADDESLEWTDLSSSVSMNGVEDFTYYENAYKLTFNEVGTYYLRAKCNDKYVYSIPIIVNADNTNYLETEFDGKIFMTQAQVSRGSASFKFTGCTPEEVDELENTMYIKYKNSSILHKGLYVSYVRTDSYCLYYTYNQTDDYNSSGALFQKTTYNENYKPTQVDNYSEGILTKSKSTTYDELERTYSVITTNYDTNGNITSRSGYYYTYDESGKQIFHSGIPTE